MLRMPRAPTRKATKQTKARLAAVRARASLPGADFSARVQVALDRGEPDAISDQELQKVLAAAVKCYAAKAERRGSGLEPFPEGLITATETVVAACAMIRAADLNIFDVAMWFHRPAT
jgi:hypothetical protein